MCNVTKSERGEKLQDVQGRRLATSRSSNNKRSKTYSSWAFKDTRLEQLFWSHSLVHYLSVKDEKVGEIDRVVYGDKSPYPISVAHHVIRCRKRGIAALP